ncbi:MAG: TonB C-terminal domain-containing protein [Deltaproteobacteria bacterium]|jgi:outer membrane biosynthesis protein TonB|nr:TonB C-terminal domain-containing protein [Deltaproteobacteria bacterium]
MRANQNIIYSSQESFLENGFLKLLIVSAVFHLTILVGAVFVPNFFTGPREKPMDVITVQLLGAIEPPAPAAPAAPVDPNLKGPDVVELPKSENMIPQPTPLEKMIAPVIPTDVIPIGERPPDAPIPEVVKNQEPPPKIELPEKPPEPKLQPKKNPQKQNPEAALNKNIESIRRKVEAKNEDQQINSAIGNIAEHVGKGNGTSSLRGGANNSGALLDPVRRAYYTQIMEIVRSNWVPPAAPMTPDLTSTFVIVIQPDGIISGKLLRSGSGSPDFDLSVEQAINRSSFPPLPDVFQGRSDNPALQFQLNYLTKVG